MSVTKLEKVFSREQCQQIIDSAVNVRKWHIVEQRGVEHNVFKCYIKPFIEDLLKTLPLEIPESCAVELIRYKTGSLSNVHLDNEGTHMLGHGNCIETEWKQTGIIVLNDEYDGGELYFPKMNITYDKGSMGDLILFLAGNYHPETCHGVTEVTSGVRYSLVFRFI